MEDEMLILVDEKDRQIGTDTKINCHKGNARRHRAFTTIYLNDKNEMLLARRASRKITWPNFWDLALSSHHHPGETHEAANERKSIQELGTTAPVKRLFSFEYHVPYNLDWSEWEHNHILIGKLNGKVTTNLAEVSEVKWIGFNKLKEEIARNPNQFAPWTIIAIREFFNRGHDKSTF